MDRRQFSRNVLQVELGFTPLQLDYLFAMPGKKTFEVVFATYDFFEQCVDRFTKKKVNNARLENIRMLPLSEMDEKSVTVIMYSENVNPEDIQIWLSLRCTVQRGMVLRDEDGVKTGAHRYYVKLKRDQTNGSLQHLPSTIQLGRIRGNVFYASQPKTCRKCGSNQHLAAACNNTHCRNCRSARHSTRDCDQPMKCNLCGASTHTYRTCPRSYANRAARQPDVNPWADTEEDMEENPEPDPDPDVVPDTAPVPDLDQASDPATATPAASVAKTAATSFSATASSAPRPPRPPPLESHKPYI